MIESLTFDKYSDTSYSTAIPNVFLGELQHRVREEPAPYLTAQRTVATDDIWHWEELFFPLIARTQELSEPEIPEIFTLRPIATQRITLKIREIKIAQFRYVRDIDDDDKE
jgi:hypothetical protein